MANKYTPDMPGFQVGPSRNTNMLVSNSSKGFKGVTGVYGLLDAATGLTSSPAGHINVPGVHPDQRGAFNSSSASGFIGLGINGTAGVNTTSYSLPGA